MVMGATIGVLLTQIDFTGTVHIKSVGLSVTPDSYTWTLNNATGATDSVDVNLTNTGQQLVNVMYQILNADANLNVTVSGLVAQLASNATDTCTITVTVDNATGDSGFTVRFIAREA